jgi:AAA+ superfamily predicted ATPase
VSAPALPQGVRGIHALPADHHEGPWDAIITPPGVKERILGTVLLRLLHGPRLATLAGPLHGLVVLAGLPGTGKTTLAQGVAQAAALAVASRGATTLVEIDPHAFPSDMLGESQRNISRLMGETVPELASRRPHTVVVIDEVESFAVRRSSASFETNPVDVHRATDAVLAGMDTAAASHPRLVFVVTTNFVDALDEAFISRADLLVELSLPDVETRARIIADSLAELALHWPSLAGLAQNEELHSGLAKRTEGWDGRRLRKLALGAIARNPAIAADPSGLAAGTLEAEVDSYTPWRFSPAPNLCGQEKK